MFFKFMPFEIFFISIIDNVEVLMSTKASRVDLWIQSDRVVELLGGLSMGDMMNVGNEGQVGWVLITNLASRAL